MRRGVEAADEIYRENVDEVERQGAQVQRGRVCGQLLQFHADRGRGAARLLGTHHEARRGTEAEGHAAAVFPAVVLLDPPPVEDGLGDEEGVGGHGGVVAAVRGAPGHGLQSRHDAAGILA